MELKDLPPKYQKQALEKMNKKEREQFFNVKLTQGTTDDKTKGKKYGNHITFVDGIRFDSKREAIRFETLKLKQKHGHISDLKLQVHFTLQEQWKDIEGEIIRGITYIADFTYMENGKYIIEDVKSEATRKNAVYKMKRKMMAEKGFKVKEV